MTELKVNNTTYRLQLVQVVSGNLYALTELIKKHNDYRSRVNDDMTVDVAMFIHKYRMDSPYINDDTGKQDFKGYAQVELAVLPEITPNSIQQTVDNGSDALRGFIIVDGTNYIK